MEKMHIIQDEVEKITLLERSLALENKFMQFQEEELNKT